MKPREKKTKHSKQYFRSKFALNPIDESLEKANMINVALDKTQAKELLALLNKNYYQTKKTKNECISKDQVYNHLKKLAEEPKNKSLSHCDIQLRKSLKKLVLQGNFMDKYRKEMWMLVSGARSKMLNHEDYYEILKSDIMNYPTTFLDSIELDLKRTFPKKPIYDKNDPYIQKMRNVLHCYAKRNPSIGYCQGLNFIVSKILQIVPKEEEAFWLLAMIIESIVPTDYYTSMEGVLVDQEIFRDISNYLYPNIKDKLNQLQIDSSLFSLQWFVCLFTSALPDALLYSVWDLLILDGCSILFKAGLFLLNKLKLRIKKAKEFHEIFQFIDEESKQLESKDNLEFLQKIQGLYINKRLLGFLRDIYRISIKKNIKEFEQKKLYHCHTPIRKEPKPCRTDWPICVDLIDKTDKTRAKSPFIFRVHNIPIRIIPHYFNNEEKNYQQRFRSITKYNNNSFSMFTNNSLYQQHESSLPSHNLSLMNQSSRLSTIFGSTTDNPISLQLDKTILNSKVQDEILVGRHMHTCKESRVEAEIQKLNGLFYNEDRIFESIKKNCKLLNQANNTKSLLVLPSPLLPSSPSLLNLQNKNNPNEHKSLLLHSIDYSYFSNICSNRNLSLNGNANLNLAGSFYNVLNKTQFQVRDSNENGHPSVRSVIKNNGNLNSNTEKNSILNKSDSKKNTQTSTGNSKDDCGIDTEESKYNSDIESSITEESKNNQSKINESIDSNASDNPTKNCELIKNAGVIINNKSIKNIINSLPEVAEIK